MTDMSEADLQRDVIRLAHLRQWRVAHFRPAQTDGRWSTAVSADGAGFPDLVMARRGHVIIVELKSQRGKLSLAQEEWLDAFSYSDLTDRRLRCFVWRPADWLEGRIEQALM